MGQGRGEGGKILEEALLSGLRGVLRVGGQVGDRIRSRQGAGRPSAVLGPERPARFKNNNK